MQQLNYNTTSMRMRWRGLELRFRSSPVNKLSSAFKLSTFGNMRTGNNLKMSEWFDSGSKISGVVRFVNFKIFIRQTRNKDNYYNYKSVKRVEHFITSFH